MYELLCESGRVIVYADKGLQAALEIAAWLGEVVLPAIL